MLSNGNHKHRDPLTFSKLMRVSLTVRRLLDLPELKGRSTKLNQAVRDVSKAIGEMEEAEL